MLPKILESSKIYVIFLLTLGYSSTRHTISATPTSSNSQFQLTRKLIPSELKKRPNFL